MKKILLIIFFFTVSSFFIVMPNKILAASDGITCTPPATCYEPVPGCPSDYSEDGLCTRGSGQGAHGGVCCTAPAGGGGGGGGGGGSQPGDWGDPGSGPSLYSISNLLGSGAPNNAPTSSYEALIRLFLGILIVASIVLFVIFFIWGGISWIMSGGDKQKLQSSKQKLTFSIIGLVVVFTAVIIINFLFTFLEGI